MLTLVRNQALKIRKSSIFTASSFSSGNVRLLDTNDVARTKLEVKWSCGSSREYLATWLRDHDPISIHPESKQRQSNTLEMVDDSGNIPRPSKPVRAWIEDENGTETLQVEWSSPLILSGGIETPTTTSFPKKWLTETYGIFSPLKSEAAGKGDSGAAAVGSTTLEQNQNNTTPRFWGGDYATVNPSAILEGAVQYERYMEESDPSGLIDVLGRLRRDGFAVIRGCPTTSEGTGRAIERIGFMRRTMYSDGVWDTAVRPAAQDNDDKVKEVLDEVKTRVSDQYSTSVVDTAYTNLELYPHTDCTYYRDPPALQFFNCAEAAPIGGATWIVDGFAIAASIKQHFPESYDFFTKQVLAFHCIEPNTHVEAIDFPFKLNHTGEKIIQFRYNNDDRAPLKPSLFQPSCQSEEELQETLTRFYEEHLPNLLKTSQLKSMACELKLTEGDMLVLNNHRVLHGRRSFQGPRNMVGAYMGLDEYESACRLYGLPHEIGAHI